MKKSKKGATLVMAMPLALATLTVGAPTMQALPLAQGNATYEMPADSLNGNVRVTAIFEPDGTNAYKLVFSDEFNQPNGSMPDPTKWERSVRENPTWKRFIAMTETGQQETGYIENGELVLRNPANTQNGFADFLSLRDKIAELGIKI